MTVLRCSVRCLLRAIIGMLLVCMAACAPKLIVRSDPSEAEVFVNDKPIGKTPLEVSVRELPRTSSYELRVQKEGYLNQTAQIPGMYVEALQYEVFVGLKKGEDEITRFNRNMGFLVQAQKHVLDKRYNDALQLVEQSIAENPRYIHAQMLKASILFLSENYPASLAQWRKVIEIDPANAEAARMISFITESGGKLRAPSSAPTSPTAPASGNAQ